jgi:hypothetical protein
MKLKKNKELKETKRKFWTKQAEKQAKKEDVK